LGLALLAFGGVLELWPLLLGNSRRWPLVVILAVLPMVYSVENIKIGHCAQVCGASVESEKSGHCAADRRK